MLMNSVFIAGTLILNVVSVGIGAGAGATGAMDHAGSPAATSSTVELAVTDSFAPAPRRKRVRRSVPRPAPNAAPAAAPEADEEEAASPVRRPAPTTTRRRPAVEEEQEEAASADEDEEEDEKPRASRKRRRPVDEEEEEEDEEEADMPLASMPSVVPRMFSLEVGFGFIGRNFAYNTALQKESTFPRLGLTGVIEAFPLLRMARGWYKRLGVAFAIDTEFGAAALQQSTGASISYPVSQRRWSFDVRYAIVAGERVVIMPAIGLASNAFDLKTSMPMAPSACNNMSTVPCLADVSSMYVPADLHIRIALTEEVALSVGGGYLLGLSVEGGPGRLAAERTAKMAGYHFEIGGSLMVKNWLAFRLAIPYVHYGYTFSGGSATYTSASETYYGATISALVFTR